MTETANPTGTQGDGAQQGTQQRADINVGPGERLGSLLVGGAMILGGLLRRSIGGLVVAAAGGGLLYRGLSGHCPAYSALGVNTAEGAQQPLLIERSVLINRPPEDLYRFFRNFENLPRFIDHLKSVGMLDEKRSRWAAASPGGGVVEWDTEITADIPGELIAWRSIDREARSAAVGDGGEVSHEGSVRFHGISPERGTEVKLTMKYNPAAGRLGSLLVGLLGKLREHQIEEDLRHFKQIMEAGEIPVANGHSQVHATDMRT